MRSTVKKALSDVSVDEKNKDLLKNLTGNVVEATQEELTPKKKFNTNTQGTKEDRAKGKKQGRSF